MSKLFIPILQGTSREGRQSIRVSELIYEVSKQYKEVTSVLVDPCDFEFPGDGNAQEVKDPKYTEIVKKADGFFIVTPEYNHSIPGSLKRMLDSESEGAQYNHKAVALAGVSAGPWGGTRAIQSLVPMVREMGLVATAKDVHFPNVYSLFDDEGKLTDGAYIDRIKGSFDELIWMAQVLKAGRDNQA